MGCIIFIGFLLLIALDVVLGASDSRRERELRLMEEEYKIHLRGEENRRI